MRLPTTYIVVLTAACAVAMGVALGIYISAELSLQPLGLCMYIVVTMVCASLFAVFTHFASASTAKLLQWIIYALQSVFPRAYFLEGQGRMQSIEDADRRFKALFAVEGARPSLLGLYAAIFMLMALQIKFKLAALKPEKSLDHGVRDVGFRMMGVGNLATVTCFVMCLILNVNITGGSDYAIFFVAPILLLLNWDSDLFAGFGDRYRYFPVTMVISGYLVLSALSSLEDVKNLGLLILTVPSHILFDRFMRSCTKQSDVAPLPVLLSLNLPSILFTDMLKIRILGLLGIVYSLAQCIISRQQYISGLKARRMC